MALTSYTEHIVEAQLEHGARGYISPFIFPTPPSKPASTASSDPDEVVARMFDMTPEKWREFRIWIQKTTKECNERLAREKVVVYKLNEQRTSMTPVGYMTKGEAVKTARGVIGGELLDLDTLYGGMFVRAGHFFISENKLLDGLQRYGSDVEPGVLIDHLIDERSNERRAA